MKTQELCERFPSIRGILIGAALDAFLLAEHNIPFHSCEPLVIAGLQARAIMQIPHEWWSDDDVRSRITKAALRVAFAAHERWETEGCPEIASLPWTGMDWMEVEVEAETRELYISLLYVRFLSDPNKASRSCGSTSSTPVLVK